MLYTALACAETVTILFTKKPWRLVPGVGETLILFYVMIWWFFCYLYLMVYFDGNQARQKAINMAHIITVIFSVVWYYLFWTWILKKAVVLQSIVFLVQNYGYVALVIAMLCFLKDRVPIGKFLDEKKWKISMILLSVYAAMLLTLTIIGGNLATGGVPANTFEYLLEVLLVGSECAWFIVGCTSMISEGNPLHAYDGENLIAEAQE